MIAQKYCYRSNRPFKPSESTGRSRKRFNYLVVLLALQVITSSHHSAAAQKTDVRDRFGVGEALVQGEETAFRQRLLQYKSADIGLVRLDFEWRNHETSPNQWHNSVDGAAIGIAAENGFQIKVNIGAINGPPGWFFELHPDAQMTNQNGLKSSNVVSYWYPGLELLLEEKDAHLFSILASSPQVRKNIAYIIVPFGPAGEPIYPVPWTTTEPASDMRFWFYDPHAQADFPQKMREKYETIERANTMWGTNFADWSSFTIPVPGTQKGELWHDVLSWYRDSKRAFIYWQIDHYKRLVAEFFSGDPAPKLVILIPGTHLTPFWEFEAVRTGDGNDLVKAMEDSLFLIDVAERNGAQLQYTGLPNMEEVEYLQAYIKRRRYHVKIWGENAGNTGKPMDLDQEVLVNALYGQEYIGSNLFEPDLVTPTSQFSELKASHKWLSGIWQRTNAELVSFDNLVIVQGTCIHADLSMTKELCLGQDARLTLYSNNQPIWSSASESAASVSCSIFEEPSSFCRAVFQGDGNFVIYKGPKAIWNSNTAHRGKLLRILPIAPYVEIVNAVGEKIWSAEIH